MSVHDELSPFLLLILAGFLPTDLWRLLGVAVARNIDEKSELTIWVRAVAVAILGGVIADLALTPPGALAEIRLSVRLSAIAFGFFAFLVARRSVFVGVFAGEVMLVAGGFWFGS